VVFYLVTRQGHATISQYLRTRGRALAPMIRVVLYEHLPFRRALPTGTYVFADVERLTPEQATLAAQAWAALVRHGADVRLLNHPTRSMRRVELLRALHERGRNDADVYRATDGARPARFPVFLRHANDHGGSLSELLATPEQLARELARLERDGVYRDDLIITEFSDTADAGGVFRKYSCFRIGNHIVPRHLLFSRAWNVKIVELTPPEYVREELEFVRTNPHRDELLAIFDLARIQLGRIDYALRDGRIQTWEINTNPILGTFEDGGMPERAPVIAAVTPALADALRALESRARPARVSLATPERPAAEIVRARVRTILQGVLLACGLERLELPLTSWLARLWRALLARR
jgi:hypothetical protein